MSSDCPLCQHTKTFYFSEDKRRTYFRCSRCHLVFADTASCLSAEDEKAIYDQHENHVDDPGYRGFLGRFVTPLLTTLQQENQTPDDESSLNLIGLDFGCGPGPALAAMLAESGIRMSLYDPFYANDLSVLSHQYDLVTCTEAIEHFNTPHKEWALLLRLLKPHGLLAIMTKLVIDADAFSRWHYKNDPTHVSFFSRETFCYLAKRDGFEVHFVGNDVILMRKIVQ